MFLPLPDILRFKGKKAVALCDLWETALRGRCKRDGNTLVLKVNVKVEINSESVRERAGVADVPPFGFEDAAHEAGGRNGRHDAPREQQFFEARA
jgi:hypothetical protein